MLHRELLDYLPDFLRDLTELKEIMAVETVEIENVHDRMDLALENAFIDTADSATIARMEKMYSVPVQPDATLEDRKFSLKAVLNQSSPFTYRTLCRALDALCGEGGYSVEITPGTYTAKIRINLSRRNNYLAAQSMVEKVIPCNLLLDMSLLYNQHQTLAHYTHGELAEYTHDQLRNDETLAEVI